MYLHESIVSNSSISQQSMRMPANQKEIMHWHSCHSPKLAGRAIACIVLIVSLVQRRVTKFLNLAKSAKNMPETVREHYAVLNHHANECIHCGQCETRCPFGVNIRDNMNEAVKVFGK